MGARGGTTPVTMGVAAWVAACMVVAAGCTGGPGGPSPGPSGAGPLVITNARLLGREGASTVVIHGDTITSVGRGPPPAGATVIDAEQGWVLPGLWDGHIHALSGGLAMDQIELDTAMDADDVARAVRQHVAAHPQQEWVFGRGWSYDVVPAGTYPGRALLDAVAGPRKVVLESYDGHALWVSTAALEAAGIDATTDDPDGGVIVREADGRTPGGTLLEDAAALVEEAAPPMTRAQRIAAIERALRHCAELGLTGVTEIAAEVEVVEMYIDLARAGRLPIRVAVALPLDGDLDRYERLRAAIADVPGDRLHFGYLKGFLDGVIESRTAYLLEPYPDSEERGRPHFDAEALYALVSEAHRRGFSVGLHAIGDGAVRLALDTFERVQVEQPRADVRHRVEHIEVLDPADAARFRKQGVIASMQPLHATPSDAESAWERNLGPERLPRSFPWRTLADAGATLAFGSDWPVMSADPLWGIALATTRQDRAGQPAGGWQAHQRVGIAEAVVAYAAGSPGAVGLGERLGAVAPGRWADLVVLHRWVDLERPRTLWEGPRVRAVVVGGAVVVGER